MSIEVTSAFDGGNAELVSVDDATATVRLRIRPDGAANFLQWFHVRLAGVRDRAVVVRFENAGKVSYPDGFRDYQAVVSEDGERWRRARTEFDGEVLTVHHHAASDVLRLAYFEPYSLARHDRLIARCGRDPRVRLETLGTTLDGHALDALHVGAGSHRVWLIARQHPGETMAEHWMEGFLERLLDIDEPVARAVLGDARLHIVPNMNPDGSRRGHLRTNAAGANLNREWMQPTPERSPEVFFVRRRMLETGVDLCLDVHGDEALPHVFLVSPLAIPSVTTAQRALFGQLSAAFAALSPDFQTEHGYPMPAPGAANLTLCTNYVAETFGCLAATLEMPFKDTATRPRPDTGWSAARSRHLGRSFVDVLWRILPRLRDVDGVA